MVVLSNKREQLLIKFLLSSLHNQVLNQIDPLTQLNVTQLAADTIAVTGDSVAARSGNCIRSSGSAI